MRKSLQILLGLFFILVLAYLAFLDVSTKIKDDLLTKTKIMFSENNVRDVTVTVEGEGLEMSRSLILTGTAISEVERVRIVTLIENVEGICNIDNQVKIYPVVPKAPIVPKVPTVIKVPVLKTTTTPNTVKSTLTEAVVLKSTEKKDAIETVVEKKELTSSVSSSSSLVTNVPTVPKVQSSSIVVPTPVQAISAPKVIEIEKIKLEGVK